MKIERKRSSKIPAWKKPVKALHILGFNSTQWLQKERKDEAQADKDIRKGRVSKTKNLKELFKKLDSIQPF